MSDAGPGFRRTRRTRTDGALTRRAPAYKPGVLNTGDTVSFETTDLDGNPVSSAELFSESRITMVNLWATWCTPCKRELPDLAELAKEFEAKGCRIVGICTDANDESKVELAREILKDSGAEYLNLIAPEGVKEVLPTTSIPMSFFFDSEGRLVGEVKGARVDQYVPTLEAALEQLGQS